MTSTDLTTPDDRTMDAPPPPGGTYPIPYLVAVPSGACGAGFCNVAGVI